MVHSFQALGTTWWITLFDAPNEADVIFDDIGRFVLAFESSYSRFRPDSLISRLNTARKLESPDDECRALLAYGKQLYLRTNSHFNLLTGHILEARGYDADYTFVDSATDSLSPGNPVTDLLISPTEIEVLHGNVDLGGFGKGYLIDRIADRLQNEHRLKYFLINGGGDMYATSNNGEPIEIYLEHPQEPGRQLTTTRLLEQGFAASSIHKRRWPDADGTQLTHIVGDHSTDGIFIKADTAAVADAFATTFLLVDTTEQERLAQQENLAIARFSLADGRMFANQLFMQ